MGGRATPLKGPPGARQGRCGSALRIDPEVAQIVARLWDVAPDEESQLLVGRGSFRPRRQGAHAWYLHPAVWRFRPGHTLKLELLGGDPLYSRPSNGTFWIELSDPRLRLLARSRRR